ncbi:M4 family metallopeptidase [Nonomuraea sp. NPDC050536]|uniref:M4 family metallopeptidase n=1 Tax=Nonomuraea sp. NPDC050536 TaxID=3364366 RepID=UPI0037CAE319
MKPKLRLGAAAVLAVALSTVSLAGATSAGAARAVDPPSPDPRHNAIATSQNLIKADKAALQATDQDSFALTSSIEGPRGLQYLTYGRTHAGLPVYGGDVVVATDSSGAVVQSVASGQQSRIDVSTKPAVTAVRAAVTARTRLAKVASVATPTLVIHATTAKPRLAWEVVVTGADHPSTLHVYVDAGTGKVIDQWDEVREGTGNSYYNGNPVTIDTTPAYTMRDPNRSGIQCGGQNGQPYTKSTDSWGNGGGTNLETACVDALFDVQHEWDMLKNWLGRNGINGQGGGYPAYVGLNEVNAYWTGSYATFGHNQAGSQQLTSMDVVGHEFGHGVFQFSGGGGSGSGNETGGLNESTGDIFGALLEHYVNEPASLDPPDYLVGEEVNLAGNGPIRNMQNPSATGDPNCYSSSIPSTEVHAAAGPQNHWFYLVAEGTNGSTRCDGGAAITGIGIQKAGQIYLAALNTKTLPWTYGKARVATLNAAKSLFSGCNEFNVVKAAWSGVSVGAQSGEPTCTAQQNDFSLALDPASGTVQPGGTATTTVRTTVTSGSAQQITLSTGTLPAGVTAQLNPPTITAGQTSTLTLTTSAGSSGTQSIQVIATGANATHQANYTLQIGQPSSDYSFTVSPASASVQAGQSATATISTQVTAGQTQQITLSATNVPSGVTVTFNPQTINAGQSSTVTFTTTASVSPNTYPIGLNADGAGADHTATFSLTVSGSSQTTWQPWTAYATGAVVTYNGVQYRCLQAHTSQPDWTPPAVPALWQPI